MTDRHWHEDRRTIGRYEHRGVDHSSTGTLLAEVRHGNEVAFQLVWFKGFETPVCGVRGFGHVYRPAHLTILGKGGYWKASILEKGRVTAARLAGHAARIDAVLGDGVTALIDPKRTLVVIGSPDADGKSETD
jgi:hypothetical protein